MKKAKLFLLFILPITIGTFLVASCDKEAKDNLKIGGTTDYAENQVGATSTGYVSMDGNSVSNQIKTTVLANNDGITTVNFTFTIPSQYLDKINNFGNTYFADRFATYKTNHFDGTNKVTTTVKLFNSSEGLAFVNSEGKQFVVLKYDANVGDKWYYTKKNGKKVYFEVGYKSTTDDYAYGMMNIKVIKVEQTLDEPGFTKIVYIGNHKFGFVGIEINLEDGTVIKMARY